MPDQNLRTKKNLTSREKEILRRKVLSHRMKTLPIKLDTIGQKHRDAVKFHESKTDSIAKSNKSKPGLRFRTIDELFDKTESPKKKKNKGTK